MKNKDGSNWISSSDEFVQHEWLMDCKVKIYQNLNEINIISKLLLLKCNKGNQVSIILNTTLLNFQQRYDLFFQFRSDLREIFGDIETNLAGTLYHILNFNDPDKIHELFTLLDKMEPIYPVNIKNNMCNSVGGKDCFFLYNNEKNNYLLNLI